MLGNIALGLALAGVVLFQGLCCVVVARLKARHPQLYRELGRPAPIDRYPTFLSVLRRRDDFSTLDPTVRRLVEVLRLVSVLIPVFLFGASVLAFSAQR